MTAKLASLTGWRLLAVLAALGLASYFAISTLLHIATSLIPLVSVAGALLVVGWALFANQHEHSEPE
jgi:CHASE2 domain-containing sensor protein